MPQHLENILFVPSVRSGNSCGTHSRMAAFTTTRVRAQVGFRGWRFSSKSLALWGTLVTGKIHSPTCARLPSPSGSRRNRRGGKIGFAIMAAKVTCAPNQTWLLRLQARHTTATSQISTGCQKHGIWNPSPLAPLHPHPSTSRSWKAISGNKEDLRLVVIRCTTGYNSFFRKRKISSCLFSLTTFYNQSHKSTYLGNLFGRQSIRTISHGICGSGAWINHKC